jgi:hypothetical protein
MAWDCGAGHSFELLLRRRLALNIFLLPVTTAKLIGEFYNNRWSAAHGCPRFAYSFVFVMLRQYNWRCDSFSANMLRIYFWSCYLLKPTKNCFWWVEGSYWWQSRGAVFSQPQAHKWSSDLGHVTLRCVMELFLTMEIACSLSNAFLNKLRL